MLKYEVFADERKRTKDHTAQNQQLHLQVRFQENFLAVKWWLAQQSSTTEGSELGADLKSLCLLYISPNY